MLMLIVEEKQQQKIWKNKPQSFLVSRTMNLFLISHFFRLLKIYFFPSFMLIYYFYISFYYHGIIMKLKYIFQFDVIGFEREKIHLPPPPPTMSDHYYYNIFLLLWGLTWCDSFDAKRDVIISYYSRSRTFLPLLNRIQFMFMNDILLNSFQIYIDNNIPIWIFKKRSNGSEYERIHDRTRATWIYSSTSIKHDVLSHNKNICE